MADAVNGGVDPTLPFRGQFGFALAFRPDRRTNHHSNFAGVFEKPVIGPVLPGVVSDGQQGRTTGQGQAGTAMAEGLALAGIDPGRSEEASGRERVEGTDGVVSRE